jgi:hypothetical protein
MLNIAEGFTVIMLKKLQQFFKIERRQKYVFEDDVQHKIE